MHTLRGLLSPGFSFPGTLALPQTTAIAGCRPWSATINPSPPQSPNTHFLGVVAASANDVWAVGLTVQPPDNNAPALTLIEHWDGQNWQIIESPNPNPEGDNALFSVAAVGTNDIWAVGFSGATPGARGFSLGQTLIEHWDGARWQVIPSPNQGSVINSLSAVAVVGADDIWAAGLSGESSSGPFSTLIQHWDGKTWQVVPSPNPASVINELVSVVAISAHDVWAVGLAADTFFQFTTTLIEHCNGRRWRVVASPNPGWAVNSLLA